LSYQTSTELAELKSSFLRGEQPAGCARCWQDEAAGLPSKRTLDWQYVLDQTVPDLNNLLVLSFSLGNTCNLACRICNSYSSSKWLTEAKLLKETFPEIKIFKHKKFYQDQEFLDSVMNISQHLTHVEFPGGEPFLTGIKQHLEFLDFLILNNSEKISLHYTTNTTHYPGPEFWTRWSRFKQVDLQLSIDGTESKFEYNRWPAKWLDCNNNIARYQTDAVGNIKLSISHSVSIFTVYHLPEFLTWIQQLGLPDPYLGLVSNPVHYAITTFPNTIKQQIIARLADPAFANIVNYMNNRDTSDQFQLAVKYIQQLDKQRNQSFSKIFPELANLML
jgi:MoaA/NifB/PqqE/SkfB family radical SAM enzyme